MSDMSWKSNFNDILLVYISIEYSILNDFKVKQPAVCPNMHTFCSLCIDIWLEKTKQCPTCRVSITKDNPCRRLLGGYDSKDDLLVPTEFSHSSTRKARFFSLFQQYEDEITRLLTQIDALNNEITNLKVCFAYYLAQLGLILSSRLLLFRIQIVLLH